MREVPVVVVGAGPVGLTAALLLARRGVEVLVVERHPAPYPLPRAVHLDDESFRVLQAAGVADAVASVSRPMAGLRLVDGGLRPLAEFARDPERRPHGWPSGSLFAQPDVEAVLRDAVAGCPLITLRTAVELLDLRQDGTGVEARLTDGPVRARWLLGCDGANSTVRTLIGSSMRELGAADRWLVLDARAAIDRPVWPGVHQVCDPRRPATFLPVTGDRYRWEFRLAEAETAGALAAPDRLGRLLAPFGVGEFEVLRAAEYVFRAAVADRWRDRRVLLAGDAAHLTPPFIGQGLGLGLRDVHQLAWKLAAVLDGTAAETLVDTYQAERAAHARGLIRIALLLGRLMTGGGRAAGAGRRLALSAIRRIPATAALAATSRTPPLPAGPLVDRSRRPGRRLAGGLVPQPEVVVDGRPARLDDVLGPGWARISLDHAGRLTVTTGTGTREIADPAGLLRGWLQRAGAREVVVRPDRIVRAASGPRSWPVPGPWPVSARRSWSRRGRSP